MMTDWGKVMFKNIMYLYHRLKHDGLCRAKTNYLYTVD